MDWFWQIVCNMMLSGFAFYLTLIVIPQVKDVFVKANLFGIDQCKRNNIKIPESQGAVAGCVFLVVMILFILVPFGGVNGQALGYQWLFNLEDYRHEVFVQFISALLSINSMLFLGFADDVLDLRWRTKLILPTIASLPLLMVYGVTYNNTTIIVPKPVRWLFGYSLWLGPLYYVYMSMLCIFCTNAINIVAGINGIEAGQGAVIALSIICYNLFELCSDQWQAHLFSLHFMIPFFMVTLALLYHNWYPSKVFVGDTYCYFAGMTFAVVGILGHFSKTMLLFFIPQVFNFIFSCPQLFHLVPCPRHRLPKFNPETNKLTPSTFQFKVGESSSLGVFIIGIFRFFRLVECKQVKNTPDTFECSNLTIINCALVLFGPMNERTLTISLLVVQMLGSVLAFFIRYYISQLVF